MLETHGITCSMSRRGNCYDHAVQGPSLLIGRSGCPSPPQYVITIDLASIVSLQAGWWQVQNKRVSLLSVAGVVAWVMLCNGWKPGLSRCGG